MHSKNQPSQVKKNKGKLKASKRFHCFYSGPFSQFSKYSFVLDGIEFNCAEQAMMWHKAQVMSNASISPAIKEANKFAQETILAETKPSIIKSYGRKLVKGFNESAWNSERIAVVFKNNMAKFSQNHRLQTSLLETDGKILVEAARNDSIWGCGYSQSQFPHAKPDMLGLNLLGLVLTCVRESIKRNPAHVFKNTDDPIMIDELAKCTLYISKKWW
jgi:ribA/ribD-fused uncharacterized protein